MISEKLHARMAALFPVTPFSSDDEACAGIAKAPELSLLQNIKTKCTICNSFGSEQSLIYLS